MPIRTLLVAAALCVAALPALATPQPRDATEMWFTPSESGWGLNLFHQGNTLFGTLFVYGPDNQPTWYSAPNVSGGPEVYSGPLYESTGPWFGGAFDPGAVTTRQVGTLTIRLGWTSSSLEYTVDGVQVAKQVTPFTFRFANLSGVYRGYQYQPAADGLPEVRQPLAISITDSGSGITMDTTGNSAVPCSWTGTRDQHGQYALATGTYSCSGGASGPWSMIVDQTPHGFVGAFSGNGVGNEWGRTAAARRANVQYTGTGWRTDNWFPPGESGWGLNLVEQGDTLFATLFVYDQQRRPRWYVASALTQSGPGENAIYTGTLHATTGPYFGAPFNPAAVTTRAVGSMTFQLTAPGTAVVGYSVDGVTVSKQVSRFAFRDNNLTGEYVGYTASLLGDAPASLGYAEMEIDIQDGANGFVMTTRREPESTAPGGDCTYTAGPALQTGAQRHVAGTYACAGGETGTFTMEDMLVSYDGFTATFSGRGVNGHIAGVRLGTN